MNFSKNESEENHPDSLAFRKSFESMNLGVVPSDPEQLIKLTIGGDKISEEILEILRDAPKKGASRIYMGYYGSGKSHHLQLVRSIALQEGWVTASVELDPKSADPAKASTVYQAIIAGLEFPQRKSGAQHTDFFDLVKEIRDKWFDIRTLRYLRNSPWFKYTIDALRLTSHRREDQFYKSAVDWLGGQVSLVSGIRNFTKHVRYKGPPIPLMPQTKDNGLIYTYHLVVLNQVLKNLGYRGLALIIDEAEHVRSYSINRYLRANNFFDVLARCAHPTVKYSEDPNCDFNISDFPPFWNEGPHYALFVGLTEGEDTHDLNQKKGELSVLIYSEDEVVHLVPPDADDYEDWVQGFITTTSRYLGKNVGLLADETVSQKIAEKLRNQFEETPDSERILRNWTKLAGLPAAVLLSQPKKIGADKLIKIVNTAAQEISGERHPWDD